MRIKASVLFEAILSRSTNIEFHIILSFLSHRKSMDKIHNRWGYVSLAAFISALFNFGWHLVFFEMGKSYSHTGFRALLPSIPWLIYGTVVAAIIACLFWPRNNAPTKLRMLLSGLIGPALVIFILGSTFGVFNPDFPNGGGHGIPITTAERIDMGWQMGILFFFFCSMTTLAMPYLVWTVVSLTFSNAIGDKDGEFS